MIEQKELEAMQQDDLDDRYFALCSQMKHAAEELEPTFKHGQYLDDVLRGGHLLHNVVLGMTVILFLIGMASDQPKIPVLIAAGILAIFGLWLYQRVADARREHDEVWAKVRKGREEIGVLIAAYEQCLGELLVRATKCGCPDCLDFIALSAQQGFGHEDR